MSARRPNVVLVVLDTARADAFEPYGAVVGASPVLADLARRGTASDSVFATANWTFPSHVSLFSGRLPRDVGLHVAGPGTVERMQALAPYFLPAVLKAAGYDTKAVSANPWIHPSRGFGTGFDEFVAVQGTHRHNQFHANLVGEFAAPRLARARTRIPVAIEAIRARADHGAAEAAEVVRRWAGQLDGDRPFFWFVNLFECHSPYAPPRRFATLGPFDRVRAAFDYEHVNNLRTLLAINAGAITVRPDRVERMRRAYAGSVRAADAWVGQLLDALDAAHALDDTLLIVTSDHGENLGESGRLSHALWLDDRLIRVPFVSAGPGGVRQDRAASLAGVPGWIADAIGLEDHPWRQPMFPAGVGLAQFDPPVARGDPRLPELRQRLSLDDYAEWRLTTPSTCATDGRLKLVVEGDEEWVYDLATDPGETAPVHLDGRTAMAFGDRLTPLRAATTATRTSAPNMAAGASITTSTPIGAAVAADDEMADRLRLLGYL